MKGKENVNVRKVYSAAWRAADFLTENDYEEIFGANIVKAAAFVFISGITLVFGSCIWNHFQPNTVKWYYVLPIIAILSILAFTIAILMIRANNQDVAKQKAILATTRQYYPKVWEKLKGSLDYHLLPEDVAEMELDEGIEEEFEPEETFRQEPQDYSAVLALPVYDESMVPTTDEILTGLEALRIK